MKKNVIRLLLSLVAIMTSTSMLAENKLWIEQYGADEDGNYVMAVMMNNDKTVSSIQFDLIIPESVTAVPVKGEYVYPNKLRLNNSQQFLCKGNASKTLFQCGVLAMRDDAFVGTEGPVAFFNIKGKTNTSQVEFKLENVMMMTYSGSNVEDANSSWSGEVTVNPELMISFSGVTLPVVPGSEFNLPIVMTNSQNVQGFSMNIQLPKGFTLDENKFTMTDRMKSAITIRVFPKENNVYTLMAVDPAGAYVVRNTGTGEIFSCSITAPNTIEDGSKIVISNVEASGEGNTYPGEGATISVVDASIAKANADAKIAELYQSLKDAEAAIAEECPLVADNFKGESIKSSIDALQAAVNAAYANNTLNADYNTVMAPVAEIEAAISKLLEDAKAAQAAETKRVADNIAAYNADVVALDALQKNLDDTVIIIDADYGDYKDQATIDAVQKQITDARNAAKAAFDAVEKSGEYKSTLDEAAINTAIDSLLTAAEAAKAEADKKAEEDAAKAEQLRKDENKAAYDAVLAELNKLYASYRTTVAEIQANYKPYEDVSAELALRNALDAEKDAIEYAYKAVEKEGKFEYDLDSEALQAQIDKLLEDAKALAEKTENDRVAANQAAYDADKDEILALQAELDATVDKILVEYPEYKDVTVESRSIDKVINDAQKGADDAFAACKEEGTYSYNWNPQAIRDMIEDMLKKAEATGVEAIIADVEAGNAVVFTLDGKKHARPVCGEVNIIVRRNGEKSKVFVK